MEFYALLLLFHHSDRSSYSYYLYLNLIYQLLVASLAESWSLLILSSIRHKDAHACISSVCDALASLQGFETELYHRYLTSAH